MNRFVKAQQGGWSLRERPHLLLVMEGLRFVLTAALVLWWGYLLWEMTEFRSFMHLQFGLHTENFEPYNNAIQNKRMIFWESITIIGLLIISSLVSVWFYARDLRRINSIETFFAAMTHELRTPLASIYLQAEAIAAAKQPAKQKKYIERLLADSKELDSQVEKTLELARVIRGSQVQLQKVNVKQTIESALKQLTEAMQERLKVKYKNADVDVWADPYLLQVVWRNLLENTVKHGGKENLSVTIGAKVGADVACLTYQDNGKGVIESAALDAKLFVAGRKGRGSGVGLYLIKSLLKNMQAEVSFSSGKGFQALIKMGVCNG